MFKLQGWEKLNMKNYFRFQELRKLGMRQKILQEVAEKVEPATRKEMKWNPLKH